VELDFRPVDADNHYYEPLDACTRYLDPEYARRGVRAVQHGKRTVMLIGDRVNHFIPNPTFDPIIVPGCLDPMFRGRVPEGVDPRMLTKVEPLPREYRVRDARVAVLEEQGLAAALLFPTFACGVEQGLRGDIDATMATLHAFNCWLEEDWGFGSDDRLVGVPMISLADPVAALTEIDSLVARGARMVHIRPAPVPGPNGTGRSLGDRRHDDVWARLAEASLPVAFHLGDSGYEFIAAAWGGKEFFEPFRAIDPFDRLLVSDRAIHDAMASLICHGVLTRFPALRVASIENGSDWLPVLVKRLRKLANQTPWAFPEDPLEVVRRNVWVAPYFEDDFRMVADLIGVDRVLFGSDWPHGEGLAAPLDFLKELDAFTADEIRRIMRDNCLELLGGARA
jgi:predicted TIM-barrel fold metal-dependent hydrolase